MARKKDNSKLRRTVMLDANNKYKLQILQAKLIEVSGCSVSFSSVIEKMLGGYYLV